MSSTKRDLASNHGMLQAIDDGSLPQAQAAVDIEEVVQDEVRRAIEQVGSSPQRPLVAIVLPRRNSKNSKGGDDSDDDDEEENRKKICGLPKGIFWILIIFVLAAIASGVAVASSSGDEVSMEAPSTAPTIMTPSSKLVGLLYPDQTMEDLSPAQFNATQWILNKGSLGSLKTNEILVRHALATLYYGLGGDGWVDTPTWLTDASHCDWESVSCDENDSAVTQLELNRKNLQGSLPSEIGRLSKLNALRLDANEIVGQIPLEVYNDLSLLTSINVGDKLLTGSIHTDIGQLTRSGEV